MSAYQKVFYGELQVGKCSEKGGQKKRYKDTLNDFNIPPESWGQTAQYRAKRRRLIRKRTDMSLKQRESAKQNENAKSTNPGPRDHHQSRHSPN